MSFFLLYRPSINFLQTEMKWNEWNAYQISNAPPIRRVRTGQSIFDRWMRSGAHVIPWLPTSSQVRRTKRTYGAKNCRKSKHVDKTSKSEKTENAFWTECVTFFTLGTTYDCYFSICFEPMCTRWFFFVTVRDCYPYSFSFDQCFFLRSSFVELSPPTMGVPRFRGSDLYPCTSAYSPHCPLRLVRVPQSVPARILCCSRLLTHNSSRKLLFLLK